MSAADRAAADRPPRWGLATKLFATLILLSAVAVLVTAVLGYVRGRDALEEAIYNQLTAARQAKARQVETYFRTVRNELQMLASTKMVIDALRGMRDGYDELDKTEVSPELRAKVHDWYVANVAPELRRMFGKEIPIDGYLPTSNAGIYLQYHYIVANPHPADQRALLDDAGDGSRFSTVSASYNPLLRAAANTAGFWDLMLADARHADLVYGVINEIDFATSLRTGPYRSTHLAAAVSKCLAAKDAATTCFEDFAPYVPSNGAPIAFMAAPVVDHGVVIGVLVAQLSIEEIDKVVTGDRRWREDGFGTTGEAYLVGPDFKVRSGGRLFYENRDAYFADLKESGHPAEEIDAIRRYGTPVLQQSIVTQGTRAALSGLSGTGQIVGDRGKHTLSSWGPLNIPGVKWGIVAKIETSEAFAPIAKLERDLMIVGGASLLVVILIAAWLANALLGPLRELTDGVRRFASGNYDVKVPTRTRDEVGQLCIAFNGMVDEIRDKNLIIEAKNHENEELLLNVLPAPIANRLREGEQSIADGFAEVTVAFADLVGFTALSSEMPPQSVVALLNGLFTRFDVAAHELGIEKIKTVGDAYMAVCGLPTPVENHAERMVRMAIRMVHITREHAIEHQVSMKLRVGINSGPVVAGVIGKSKYIYDLWGDTVNLASRMESGGLPDSIQVTRPIYEKLKGLFVFEPRGAIEVKGKGNVEAWLLKL